MRETIDVQISPDLQAKLDAMPDKAPGARAHEWTPEEDAVLARYWGIKRQADVGALLGRGLNVCRRRWEFLSGRVEYYNGHPIRLDLEGLNGEDQNT